MSGNVPIDTDKLMELAAQMGGQGSNEEARDMQEESLDAIDGMGMTQAEIEASMQEYQDTQSRSSPTLEALEQEEGSLLPQEATVCEECPNAVWFASKDELKCYCRVMFLVTWSSKDPQTIRLCDGQYIGQEE